MADGCVRVRGTGSQIDVWLVARGRGDVREGHVVCYPPGQRNLRRMQAPQGRTKGKRGENSMSGNAAFEEINEAKANMDHIYDQPDPRAYFRELRKLKV